jgi:pyridinium-3,5-bisthiocarboxylic acid mononucleotide nickel chelatase
MLPEMLLHLDLISGISGDMCLGALVDLGIDPGWLEAQLTPLCRGFSIRTRTVFRSHLRAVDLTVDVTDDRTSRTYTEIQALIRASGLPAAVKNNSLAAFEKIARAEAGIHGQKLETVHFHEIGGIDSLVDILGTFLCMEKLGIARITASPVPLGSGSVTCAHGQIPVPVPATLAILQGIPVTGSDAKTEIVTPTGAALLATLVSAFGPMPAMTVVRTGYGAGKRDTGSRMPNLLRAVMGKEVDPPASGSTDCRNSGQNGRTGSGAVRHEQIAVLTTQVDDMNPEILGFVMDHLLEKGALDVSFAPVHMKKNRPGTRVEVLCTLSDQDLMIHELLAQTTAIGVRYHACDRAVLHREPCQMDTVFGPVAAKKIRNPDGSERVVPEYGAMKEIARHQGLALKTVYETVAGNFLDTEKNRR